MYRDWPAEKFLKTLGITVADVPEILLLMGAWSIPEYVTKAQGYFRDIRKSDNLWNGFIGAYNGIRIGYAAVFGASMAASVAHAFAAAGTNIILQVGSCGCLRPEMQVGDFIVPIEAWKGDGTSRSYLPKGDTVQADVALTRLLHMGCEDVGVRAFSGTVYTTTTLYAETHEDLGLWRRLGCCAVDMETAATFAIAQALGRQSAALLYVVDQPIEGCDLQSLSTEQLDRETHAERLLLEIPLALADIMLQRMTSP